MKWRQVLPGAILVVVTAASAFAQAGPLAALREKATLTDEDRNMVNNWVNQQVTAIVGDQQALSRPAVSALRTGTQGGSDAYREAVATALADAADGRLRNASVQAAARLMSVTSLADHPALVPLLRQALRDDRAAVRFLAARGFVRLREELAADGWQPVLELLVQAGQEEQSPETLEAIYEALDYRTIDAGPEDAVVLQRLLTLLQNRAEQYQEEGTPAEGADHRGIVIVQGLQDALTPQQQTALVNALGRMLQHTVQRYTASPGLRAGVSKDLRQLRRRLEMLIQRAENLLAELPQVAGQDRPNVTAAMQGANPVVEMRPEWNEWAQRIQTATGNNYFVR